MDLSIAQRIDSHHHFWQYSEDQYPWISESMGILRNDFLPDDLLFETQPEGVSGVISVQARQSIEETTWLLSLAQKNDWIKGVVGWLPLAMPNIRETMAGFRHENKLCGLRHVVQEEQDDGFLARSDFNDGVRAIKEFGWVYDLLIYARQLPFAIPFVDRHPDQIFVLDHVAKPNIAAGKYDEEWDRNLKELAKRPNVFCKFSGVATEVRGESWTILAIKPYWETALEAFGPKRLMFGSDWPVCKLKTSYADWIRAVASLASELGEDEHSHFWYWNAMRAYSLR